MASGRSAITEIRCDLQPGTRKLNEVSSPSRAPEINMQNKKNYRVTPPPNPDTVASIHVKFAIVVLVGGILAATALLARDLLVAASVLVGSVAAAALLFAISAHLRLLYDIAGRLARAEQNSAAQAVEQRN
jgi:hypothetical protein